MNDDPEIIALTSVYTALKDLEPEAQQRVLDYVARKLGLQQWQSTEPLTQTSSTADLRRMELSPEAPTYSENEDGSNLEGISPVALKWMRRNALSVDNLGKLFSIGADEIDLIANTVPREKQAV